MSQPHFKLFILAMLISVGCTTAEPNNGPLIIAPNMGGMEMTSPDDSACTSDFACEDNQVCVAGACVSGQCNVDRTCGAGETCDRSTYQCSGSTTPPCVDDTSCTGGLCVNGMCQNVECVEDRHCQEGMACNQMRCVTIASCIDGDLDGYGAQCPMGPDCDDGNAQINPGMIENGEVLCGDGVDNDCNGIDVECGESDVDGDGFSDKEGDCDDMNANINPNQTEVYYNDLDDDCDPRTNDDDQDGDGFAAERSMGPDCNDMNANINPVAEDIPGNMVDEDCDGSDREITDDDGDNDGVSERDGDCADNDPLIGPHRQEIPYNSVDDDCDASTRDNDLDEDGFGRPQDCDDDDREINPNATEIYYNGEDDDCDPTTHDGDADGDGFIATQVNGGDDCNDNNPSVNTDAEEVPYNNIDDDCDPTSRDDDLDGDGFNRAVDCNDEDRLVNPDVIEDANTNCDDGIDHNCRGGDVRCDLGAQDADSDGVPDDQDCEPNDPLIPGLVEIRNNGLDDDCDPTTLDQVEECENDAFDDAGVNDTHITATAIDDGNSRGVQYGNLVICSEEEDWYQIVLNAGDGLEVDVKFSHADGDIDVQLYRLNNGQIEQLNTPNNLVDSSVSVDDDETVYERRASINDTYFIRVYRFGDSTVRQSYTLTANVFNQCVDDVESSINGEHNDSLESAVGLPEPGTSRQVCDYDDDWYSFNISRAQNVRVDLLFSHAAGDIDAVLYNASSISMSRGVSITDDEVLEVENLPSGDYFVKVYGLGSAQNQYRIFKTSGNLQTVRVDNSNDLDIPDASGFAANFTPGTLTTVAVNFPNIPAGAIVRNLIVHQLDINHRCLADLKVTMQWDGEDVVVLWNQDGENCLDDGLDDDLGSLGCTGGSGAASWNGRLGNDICFSDRTYRQFGGFDAQGDLTLEIKDFVENNTGSLVDFNVELEYFLP